MDGLWSVYVRFIEPNGDRRTEYVLVDDDDIDDAAHAGLTIVRELYEGSEFFVTKVWDR